MGNRNHDKHSPGLDRSIERLARRAPGHLVPGHSMRAAAAAILPGSGIRDSGFGIRDSGFGIRDSGSGIPGRNLLLAILAGVDLPEGVLAGVLRRAHLPIALTKLLGRSPQATKIANLDT